MKRIKRILRRKCNRHCEPNEKKKGKLRNERKNGF